MMKTIRHGQVMVVPATEVEAGMIVAEGIVIDVSREADLVRMETPGATVVYADADGKVQVYAKVEPFMVPTLKAAYGSR